MAMNLFAQGADAGTGASGSPQQLHGGQRRFLRIVSGSDAMLAAFLPDMLAQQLVCFRIENADVKDIPLDVDELSDPAWGCAVVGGLDFDAAVQMHDTLAVLVVMKRFERQPQ